MPIFEYKCVRCGKRTEKLQRNGNDSLKACPHCGGEVRRLISAPTIQFKGSGWYVTDYQKKEKDARAKAQIKESSEGSTESTSAVKEKEASEAGLEKEA